MPNRAVASNPYAGERGRDLDVDILQQPGILNQHPEVTVGVACHRTDETDTPIEVYVSLADGSDNGPVEMLIFTNDRGEHRVADGQALAVDAERFPWEDLTLAYQDVVAYHVHRWATQHRLR